MMQADEGNDEEQEILFDDDDSVEPITSLLSLRTKAIPESPPIACFQPLQAIDAAQAALRLESFLSSSSDAPQVSCNDKIGTSQDVPPVPFSAPLLSREDSRTPMAGFLPPTASLFDASNEEEDDHVELTDCRFIPGTAHFLEMEEASPVRTAPKKLDSSIFDPIQTSSGLLLTHRRIPPSSAPAAGPWNPGTASKSRRRPAAEYPRFVPWGHSGWQPPSGTSFPLPPLLRYIRVWVAVSALILFTGTAVLVHHSFAADETSLSSSLYNIRSDESIPFHEENGIFILEGGPSQKDQIHLVPLMDDTVVPDEIILLPRVEEKGLRPPPRHRRLTPRQVVAMAPPPEMEFSQPFQLPPSSLGHTTLRALQFEFDAWKERHHKSYASEPEHARRFQIWSANHQKTSEKNARHGPCQWTGRPVFGGNHFQDLTLEEFQSQHLNAFYLQREPFVRGQEPEQVLMSVHVDPPLLHPTVQERLLEQRVHGSMGLDYQGNCKWYDVSCILRYLFSTFVYGLGGTMEPAYDANSYPTSIDWRSLGAVTDIHSQGSCGACWAITAVETVESAYFLSTGKLYDLAETEVIVCETKCEMCTGGWPQDAFDYVISNNGLPLESDMTYNADFLLLVSEQVAGNSDALDASTVSTYQQQTCPSGGGGNNNHHSGDSASISGSNTFTRYGKIKGYGYSTEKCVCYTDGSGCDCDHQNEGYAVRNLATYGPAVVCLDASTWQDYTEGIITSESGCSSGFMDVNHCVQAVGYAFMSDEEYQDEMDGKNSGDRNHNSNSGSRDSTQRKGYWIVRNQWSKYWGMNGYAYVAMGDNTCGILNDMMQAYT